MKPDRLSKGSILFASFAILLGLLAVYFLVDRYRSVQQELREANLIVEYYQERDTQLVELFLVENDVFDMLDRAKNAETPGERLIAVQELDVFIQEALALVTDFPTGSIGDVSEWVKLFSAFAAVVGSLSSTVIAVMLFLRDSKRSQLENEKLAVEIAQLKLDLARTTPAKGTEHINKTNPNGASS